MQSILEFLSLRYYTIIKIVIGLQNCSLQSLVNTTFCGQDICLRYFQTEINKKIKPFEDLIVCQSQPPIKKVRCLTPTLLLLNLDLHDL